MAPRFAALLLSIATSAFSEKPPGQCFETEDSQFLRKLRCNVTVNEGYLNAFCDILMGRRLPEGPGFIYYANVLLMKLKLESEQAVGNMTLRDESVCLSLTKIWVKKLDNFEGSTQNYITIRTDGGYVGPFTAEVIFDYIRRATFNTTFYKPPQVAAAVCKEIRHDGSCLFDVYGFRHPNTSRMTYFELFHQWNIEFSFTDTLNITLQYPSYIDESYRLPKDLVPLLCFPPVKRTFCYKCELDNLLLDFMSCSGSRESVSIIHSFIKKVDRDAFRYAPNLTHLSLVDTRLSGIPEAVFELRRLDILDMSHTNPPAGVDFDYCPANCSMKSTATRLTLSGSNLATLPNRAFCAFPMLEELALDSCHLRDIVGSPFECLVLLKSLWMSGNNITSLLDNNIKGLVSLVKLDVSHNRISNFQGSYILLTMVSLRTLSLAYNSLQKLDFYSRGEPMIEKLNIEGNQVKLWESPLFSRMRHLKQLSIARNEFTHLDSQMLRDIQHIDNVDFGWNRWDCFTCDLKNLQTLLQKHPPKCSKCVSCDAPLVLYGQNVSNVRWREDDCGPPDYYRMYVIPGLLSFMVATLLVNVAYRKRWYIMYGLLYLKVTIKGHRRQRILGRFLWDGFLSYHASDADWVRDVVLERLESPPLGFRLCIAERDFIPGMEITENILRAIAQSRTSLFVIGREFCRSRWCMFELSLAQHRLFEGSREHGLVFIKKSDVDESDMSTLLRYLTKTRTYVQIPPDGSSEALKNLFWLQLQAALQK